MTFSDTAMKELGIKKPSRWKNINTHTHTHTTTLNLFVINVFVSSVEFF